MFWNNLEAYDTGCDLFLRFSVRGARESIPTENSAVTTRWRPCRLGVGAQSLNCDSSPRTGSRHVTDPVFLSPWRRL